MRWRDGRQAKGLGDVQAMDHVMAKCTELAATRGFPPVVDVSPQAFRPVPKVWSTVVRLRVRSKIGADVKDEKLLWQIVSAGFAQRRKTILNNLRDAPDAIQEMLKKRGGASIVLCEAGIPPLRRAETFTLEEWAMLVNAMS